jgi:hypothetical protein
MDCLLHAVFRQVHRYGHSKLFTGGVKEMGEEHI